MQAAITAARIMALMHFPGDPEMQKCYATISLTAMVVRKGKYEKLSQAKLPTLLSEFISPLGGFDQLLNSPSYEEMAKTAQKKMTEALFAGDILHRIYQFNSINPDLKMNGRMSVNKMVYLIEKQSLDRVKKLEDELKSEIEDGRKKIKLTEDGLALEMRQAPRNKLKLVRQQSSNDNPTPMTKPESNKASGLMKKLDSEKVITQENQASIKEKLDLENKFVRRERAIEGYWSKYLEVSHLWASNIDLHNNFGGDGRWGGIGVLEVPSYHELYDLLSGALHYQEFGQTYCSSHHDQPIFFDTDLWLVPEKLPKPPAKSPPKKDSAWIRNKITPAVKFDPDQVRDSQTKWLLGLFSDYRRA
ncbi:MAG: hypothetical protein HOB18_05760 [Nitrospina sp.]|nr:hypothetical protein [Nitrospina sp.]